MDDVSFKRKRIHFRPNRWRGLKTKGSERSVPLWPQLEEIIRAYITHREQSAPLNELLFPSPMSESDALITDFRKALDAVAERLLEQEVIEGDELIEILNEYAPKGRKRKRPEPAQDST